MQEPIIPIPNMDVGGPVLAPILPYATAFKLLVTPITAVGIGASPPRVLNFDWKRSFGLPSPTSDRTPTTAKSSDLMAWIKKDL